MQIAIFIPRSHEGTAPALLPLWERGVADAVKPGQLSCARGEKRTLPCRNYGPAGALRAAILSASPGEETVVRSIWPSFLPEAVVDSESKI